MTTILDHLKQRHVDLDLHRPVVDEENRVAVFYLWNLSGKMVGYQQYRPDAGKEKKNNPKEGRYYTHHPKHTIAVWGLESLHLTPTVVFVTEGIFDATRLTERGFSAVAVLSNDPKHEVRDWLANLGRLVVTVCDDDKAGKKLAKVGDVSFTLHNHDLGDATDEEVSEIIRKFCN